MEEFFNEGAFYTDSNGREMIERVLNYRPDYTYNYSSDPISSNYYPVTSRIAIKDESRDLEMAILTDRAEGGTSLANGEIELMVRGGEVGKELRFVIDTFRFTGGSCTTTTKAWQKASTKQNLAVVYTSEGRTTWSLDLPRRTTLMVLLQNSFQLG